MITLMLIAECIVLNAAGTVMLIIIYRALR